MQLSANEKWFTLHLEGGEGLSVYSFNGREAISRPFEFEIELVSRRPLEKLAPFIGLPALLRLKDKNAISDPQSQRFVHGYVRRMDELHTTQGFTHYRAVIVPRLWFLSRNRNFRIFQQKTVLEMIDDVLQAQNFAPESSYAFKCFKPEDRYKKRDYCVQYGESDLYFISRLCEEEGIYYYFEHAEGGHKLIFSDMPGGAPIPGKSKLRYLPGSGMADAEATIKRLSIRHAVDADQTSLAEWNFEKPGLNLLVQSAAGQGKGAGLQEASYPQALDLEEYNYPGLYNLRAGGKHYADLALLRRLSLEKVATGECNSPRFIPAFTFEVEDHAVASVTNNDPWWLFEVRHHGEQPQALEEAAPERGLRYTASFSAIPAATRYVPQLEHPKVLAQGGESAIVNGPQGQEIHTDEYGRVKLRFHWDRRQTDNGNSSCWARVSHGWAGSGYGAIAIPRVGHEVIVDYINGDPDKPIVVGRVYHAHNMSPYTLDEHKTRTVFKSMSTPGTAGEERGFNELRVEDLKNKEEIYIHAQRDLNMHIGHDFKDHVQNERHLTVEANSYMQVSGETHSQVAGSRKTQAQSDIHLTISGDLHGKAGSYLMQVGDEIHLKAGAKAVIEAGTELSVSAGGSFISINPGGVFVNGAAVNLGGGSGPGSGSGAAPLLPGAAQSVEEALPPEMAANDIPQEECIKYAAHQRKAVVVKA